MVSRADIPLQRGNGRSPVQVFDLEVYSNCGHEGLREGVVAVAHEERRLPDPGVAHDEHLVHVVEAGVRRRVVAFHHFRSQGLYGSWRWLVWLCSCSGERGKKERNERERETHVHGMRC